MSMPSEQELLSAATKYDIAGVPCLKGEWICPKCAKPYRWNIVPNKSAYQSSPFPEEFAAAEHLAFVRMALMPDIQIHLRSHP